MSNRLDSLWTSGITETYYSIINNPKYSYFLGGSFTKRTPVICNRIASLNEDASINGSFTISDGFNFNVNAFAEQSDGKILVGGGFTLYNGLTQWRIARLNSNGSLDTSFVIGTGFDANVNTLVIQPDGKILVGGGFTSYKSLTQIRIARLNTDGSLDTSFVIGTGFNSIIYSIVLQPDGKILVGGGFTAYNGTTQNRIVRLNSDGSLDTSFIVGTGFNTDVRSIIVQTDGKILVGGTFITYNGTTQNRIARLNTDGSLDTSFIVGTGFNSNVYSVVLQPDDKILVGGVYGSYNGIVQNQLARLNIDGSLDTSFIVGSGFSGSAVNAISLQSDNKILVGGDFVFYKGTVIGEKIVRLNEDGSLDTSFITMSGFSNSVLVIKQLTTSKILVGGVFTTYKSSPTNVILKCNSNNSIDTSFEVGTGFAFTTTPIVYSIASHLDNKILVGGQFLSYNGTSKNRITRLNANGSIDTSFLMGIGFSSTVNKIIVQPDNKILVGGMFGTYNGTSRTRIARLNSDGSLDTSFIVGTGFSSTVEAFAIQTDGKILVGGAFTSYNGTTQNRIARLNTDGSLDTSFVTGTGFNSNVFSIVIQPDDKIIIGGRFTAYNGSARNRIIRLNVDGTLDTSFVIGTGFDNNVYSVVLQSDGNILAGGLFTSYTGIARGYITRLTATGALDTSFNVGLGLDGPVNTLVMQSDSTVIAGGAFNTYKSITQIGFIKINSDGTKSSDNFPVLGDLSVNTILIINNP